MGVKRGKKKASAKDGEGAGRGPCGLRKSVQVSVAQARLLACMTVYRKPPARRVVPKSLRLYILVESRNPLIKFATRSDHLHNK